MAIHPKITYQASSALPLTDKLNTSIVQCQIDNVTYRNWRDKQELTDFIDPLFTPPDSDTYMEIICQCGNVYDYATKNDVPASSLVCSCGRNALIYT